MTWFIHNLYVGYGVHTKAPNPSRGPHGRPHLSVHRDHGESSGVDLIVVVLGIGQNPPEFTIVPYSIMERRKKW